MSSAKRKTIQPELFGSGRSKHDLFDPRPSHLEKNGGLIILKKLEFSIETV